MCIYVPQGYGSRHVCVCVSICLFTKSHLTSVHPENGVTDSAGNVGQNLCGAFLWNCFSTSCIVWLPCSQPFSHCGIHICASAMQTMGRGLGSRNILEFCKFCDCYASVWCLHDHLQLTSFPCVLAHHPEVRVYLTLTIKYAYLILRFFQLSLFAGINKCAMHDV